MKLGANLVQSPGDFPAIFDRGPMRSLKVRNERFQTPQDPLGGVESVTIAVSRLVDQ